MTRAFRIVGVGLLAACASSPSTRPTEAELAESSIPILRSAGAGGTLVSGEESPTPEGTRRCIDVTGTPRFERKGAGEPVPGGARYAPFVLHGLPVEICEVAGRPDLVTVKRGIGRGGRPKGVFAPPLPQPLKGRMVAAKVTNLEILMATTVDAEGRVTSVEWRAPLEPPADIEAYFRQAVLADPFDPFVVAGQGTPFMELILLRYHISE